MNKYWQPLPSEMGDCPRCGATGEVFSNISEPNMYLEDDDVRCAECGCPGSISVDDYGDDNLTASINWHDEPDCGCAWCKKHPINDDACAGCVHFPAPSPAAPGKGGE